MSIIGFFNGHDGRFLNHIKTQDELKNGIALLEAYSIWMPKMSGMAGGLLIRACCRTGSLDRALSLLRESRQRRILLTNRGMDSLLIALGTENRLSDMLLAHGFLEKRGVNGYNARSLTIMVK